jgi:hypothetical protein
MKNSIKVELAYRLIDKINDGILHDGNYDDWHYYAFNEDYYIIGYRECSDWLENHDIGEFEAAGICQRYERDNFGESRIFDNSVTVVNMLAYIWGEELLSECEATKVKKLKKELKSLIKNLEQ